MKVPVFSIAFLAVFTILNTPSFAQEPVAELKHRPFNESFQDEAPVSGRVVAGVLVTDATAANALNLAPPSFAAGKSICVQVMSRDGRYWAENTFQLPENIDAMPVRLEYPSRHRDFLQQLDFGELAILSSAGECGEVDDEVLYLAGPGTTRGKAGVSVFVNSGRADTYIAVGNVPELRRPARCRQIEQGRRTGFDTVCQIDLHGVELAPQRVDVRILRRRYERMLPPTEFTLLLPDWN